MLLRITTARHNLSLCRLLSPPSTQTLSRCCPPSSPRPVAETRRPITTKSSTTPELRPAKKRTFGALAGFERRCLGTAIGSDYRPTEAGFDSLPNPMTSSFLPQHSPLYEVRRYDNEAPLIVKHVGSTSQRSTMHRTTGIPGDTEDMFCVFDACIQVGKFERAALVLQRLAALKSLSNPALMTLHDRFLEALLTELESDPSEAKGDELHRWFELHIRDAHLPHTPETIAILLKATLVASSSPLRQMLVRRYMEMLPEETAMESLFDGGILSDEDLVDIAQICPQYNVPENVHSANTAEAVGANEASDADPGTTLRSDLPVAPRWVTSSETTPDVRSVPQKGIGLTTLKKTLSLFSELPTGHDIASLSPAERREIQSRLEKDCVEAAVARWREENQALRGMGLNTSISGASLSARLYDWQGALEARIAEEFELIEEAERKPKKVTQDLERCLYGPPLRQSTPSRLAATTIMSTLSAMSMFGADRGVPVTTLISTVSQIVEEDIRALNRTKDKGKPAARKKVAKKSARQLLRYNSGQQPPSADGAASEEWNTLHSSATSTGWSVALRMKIGACLVAFLIDTAKITVVRDHPETKVLVSQVQQAFTHGSQLRRGKRTGVIVPNAAVVDLLMREPKGDFLARQLPMVAEPNPWTKWNKGGFLEYPVSLVRVKNSEMDQKIYAEAAIARGDMDQVLKGLDVLGRTSWKINRPVLDVMLECWNSGEAVANLPGINIPLAIPPEPEPSEDPQVKRDWIREVKALENEKAGLHSQRCYMNLQLEIARAFRDQTFYFPHNIDFRGRAYPIPTYLNHMGADHVRGLLKFGEGRPLGESGLRWLKVHLANVYGFDKASLIDREQFANDNVDNIFDSAENPMSGTKWWLEAEDPWQTLAACYELRAALKSPDPPAFVSHLPVHQDGTCNGLQHYAALGGDTWGAQQVNLEPGEKPADVYTAVADLVEENIARDLKNGVPLAELVHGKVTRKVVKQTVMTNVYGVTYVGAKKQVLKQIDDLYPGLGKASGTDINVIGGYITRKVFEAMGSMFRGAHDIQAWLGALGSIICRAVMPSQIEELANASPAKPGRRRRATTTSIHKVATDDIRSLFQSSLIWTTPLRMPVVQPYRKSSVRVVKTCMQDLILQAPDVSDPVHKRKQLQALPPNFIHSLDASHMLLSALECDHLGLTFAAVHDSFWTHACDVDAMNNVIRDAFIRIHSDDVIARLASEVKARYKGAIFLAKMKRKSPSAKPILAWRKENKMSLKMELVLEGKRQQLLDSDDPAEVEEGKAMVTPASIYEALDDSDSLVVADEIEGLGEVNLNSPKHAGLSDGEVDVDSEVMEAEAEAEVEADEVDLDAGASEAANADPELALLKLGTASTEFAKAIVKEPVKKSSQRGQSDIELWLPLTLPKMPQKGDFDVQRLRGSKYFFS